MSIYDTLNNKQREAVQQVDGPLLLLAGAGSGKTKTIVYRICYLMEHECVQPYNILAITFTNKAAGEMKERVANLVGVGSPVWVSTFHSLCVRILRRHIELLGYDPGFTIYDADDQKSLMKNIIKRLDIDTKMFKEKTLLGAISNAKEKLVDVNEYELSVRGDRYRGVCARAYREYQDTLVKNCAVDFDDLIFLCVKLFKEHPEVLDMYQERFKFIMVDEYQDTNYAQFELVRLLADRYRNLCVVGDDDQSIYAFRGADIRNILNFEVHYPEAKVIKLEQNYRSTGNILNAANGVIANNETRKDKALWTDREDGKKIRFSRLDSAYDEADFVVEDILRTKRENGLNYSDFAILYRTNAQSRVFEEMFVRDGVPYNLVAGTAFYDRQEIRDMMAYLKAVANPNDEISLRRIINVPKRGIGQASLSKVEDYAELHDISLFEAFKNAGDIMGLGKTAAKILQFSFFMERLRGLSEMVGVDELLKTLIDECEYEEYLKENFEDKYEDKIQNVYELVAKAQQYSENEEPSLLGFLEDVSLVSGSDSDEYGEDRVTLLTVHSAKGLEFKNVYLCGMEEGIFPGNMTIDSDEPDGMEEERRLAYVAITRAMDRLVITCAKSRQIRGQSNFFPVSRFVREIPEEYLESKLPRGYRDSAEEFVKQDLRKKVSFVKSVPPTAPFIAKQTRDLNMLMGIKKGGDIKAKPDYNVGDRVKHIKFGVGTVLDIVDDERDYKITVDFDSVGNKVVYAAFAKLQKV
ncbi:MAG: UvrD-helicase domain-containing protein [Lachnospiraceae bacterium]|nr:UvrD-helicase domain-containing protein [Lachnospiraceae bacterium]